MTGAPLATGSIEATSIVAGAAAADATLELAVNSDPRVDSLLVLPVDLAGLDVTPSIDVEYPEWGAR